MSRPWGASCTALGKLVGYEAASPGAPGGDAEESRDSERLPARVSGGEGEEVGVDGLHAEAPHESQCDGEEWHAVAGGVPIGPLDFQDSCELCLMRRPFPPRKCAAGLRRERKRRAQLHDLQI